MEIIQTKFTVRQHQLLASSANDLFTGVSETILFCAPEIPDAAEA